MRHEVHSKGKTSLGRNHQFVSPPCSPKSQHGPRLCKYPERCPQETHIHVFADNDSLGASSQPRLSPNQNTVFENDLCPFGFPNSVNLSLPCPGLIPSGSASQAWTRARPRPPPWSPERQRNRAGPRGLRDFGLHIGSDQGYGSSPGGPTR